jgi:hypothetical protein
MNQVSTYRECVLIPWNRQRFNVQPKNAKFSLKELRMLLGGDITMMSYGNDGIVLVFCSNRQGLPRNPQAEDLLFNCVQKEWFGDILYCHESYLD